MLIINRCLRKFGVIRDELLCCARLRVVPSAADNRRLSRKLLRRDRRLGGLRHHLVWERVALDARYEGAPFLGEDSPGMECDGSDAARRKPTLSRLRFSKEDS